MMPFNAPKALTITSAEMASAPVGPTRRSKVSAATRVDATTSGTESTLRYTAFSPT